MGFFDDVTSLVINNKEVQSIIASDGGVIYEKSTGYELVLTSDKSIIQTGESAVLSATLTNNNVPMANQTIVFNGLEYTETLEANTEITVGDTYRFTSIPHLGSSNRIYLNEEKTIYISSDTFGNKYIVINGECPYGQQYLDLFYVENGIIYYQRTNDPLRSYDASSTNTNKITSTVSNVVIEEYAKAVTDANGVATVSYTGKGVGDINVQADWNNTVQSQTLVIEDCYSYDLTNYTSTMLTSLQIPNTPFELSYKSILKSNTGHNTNLNIYGVLSDGTSEVISVIGIGNTQRAGWHLSFVSNGNWEINCTPNSKPLNTEYVVKYTYDNGLHSLYVDNQLLVSTTKIMNNIHDVWVGISASEYIKELKVKPL